LPTFAPLNGHFLAHITAGDKSYRYHDAYYDNEQMSAYELPRWDSSADLSMTRREFVVKAHPAAAR